MSRILLRSPVLQNSAVQTTNTYRMGFVAGNDGDERLETVATADL
jgi:hypothetical protein